jgi:hypothetical protein
MRSVRYITSLILAICGALAVEAQVTTSTLSGQVKSSSGDILSGASVKITHQPTGTTVSASTAANGRFIVTNLQPGGPYTVVVTYLGYQTITRNDIYLDLGETAREEFSMSSTTQELKEVVVTGARAKQFVNGGVGSNITTERMANLPTVGRNLTDFIRLTPQAKTTFGGGISIAGQNNRYNQIMFDGAVNNDVFGLSETGTNGGQTGSSPISIDAIESFQVGVSPYDVSLGNFTGGTVNAITKSGTNTLKGSAYFINRNQGFAGETPIGPKASAIRLPDFQANTIGLTVGGPIIKNKLFYFVSAEVQRDERPQPFTASAFRNPPGQAAMQDSVALIVAKLKQLGYDPGSYTEVPDLLNSDKLAAKLTWNVNEKHRVNLSYRYTNSERSLTSAGTTTQIRFFNGGYLFPSTTHSASGELTSRFTNKISNKLLLTFTNVVDDRDPLGKDFPRVTLNSINGTSYVFGTENFSTGNQLKQRNLAIFDEFRYNLGDHQFKAGIDAEYSQSYNLFIRDNYGTYTYNFVNHWLQDLRPFNYTRSFSLRDKVTGDGSIAAAEFNSVRAAVFAGDQWQVSDKFELNYGVRVDYFDFLTTPNADPYFNNTALPVLNSFWDMQGARSGQKPDAQFHIAPRVGFIYEPEKGFKVRGGAGVFTGRLPLVWPGGAFNNTGINIGGVNVNNPNINFRPDPFNQYQPADLGVTVATPSGQIDLMAKDLKLPKVLKTSFGFDRTLGKGWKVSSDFLYQYHLNEVVYLNAFSTPRAKNDLGQDVYLPITGTSVGPYTRLDFDPNTAGIQNPYATGIFVVANGTGKKGFSYNWTFSVDKSTQDGWNFNATYGWGDSYTLFDGTSSQNNSQWRFVESKNGRNNIQRSRSDFAQLHRINAYVSKKVNYLGKFLGTTLTLFYNGQSGTPYSYVYSRSMIFDQNGANAETTDLIYVPKDLADWSRFAESYTSGGATVTVAQQWERLDAYISADKFLNRRRGQFVERNGAILPFSHVVDMRIQQDINLGRGKNSHKVSVIFDMFNFTNFLNRDWGRVYVTPGVDSYSIINMEGYRVNTATNTLTPRFTYRNMNNATAADILDIRGSNYLSTRWRGQFTVRYSF